MTVLVEYQILLKIPAEAHEVSEELKETYGFQVEHLLPFKLVRWAEGVADKNLFVNDRFDERTDLDGARYDRRVHIRAFIDVNDASNFAGQASDIIEAYEGVNYGIWTNHREVYVWKASGPPQEDKIYTREIDLVILNQEEV